MTPTDPDESVPGHCASPTPDQITAFVPDDAVENLFVPTGCGDLAFASAWYHHH